MASLHESEHRLSSASTLAVPMLDFEGGHTEQRWKRHFLDIISFSADEPVSEKLFQAWCSTNRPPWTGLFHTNGAWDTTKFGDVLDEFQAASLGSMSGTWHNYAFTLDENVRTFLIAELADRMTAYVFEFATILASFLEHRLSLIVMEPTFIIAHVDSCLSHPYLFEKTQDQSILSAILYHFACAYQEEGRYQDAQFTYEAALHYHSLEADEKHPRYSHLIECLGLLLLSRGIYEKAEFFFRKNVDLRKALYGPEDTKTLESMEHLANCYRNEGKYLQAEDQFMRLLSIAKKPWASLKNNLAILRSEQGRWTEAEEIFKDLVNERTEQFGTEHPDTLSTMHNLAALYADQLKNDDAEKIIQDVLQKKTRLFGFHHPETYSTIKVSANVLLQKGNVEAARTLLERALQSSPHVIGPDHVLTVSLLEGLLIAYTKLGNHGKAKQIAQRALLLNAQSLGNLHPDTLGIVQNLASIYQCERDLVHAEGLYLSILRKDSCARYVQRNRATRNLIKIYALQGRSEEIEDLKSNLNRHVSEA